LLVRNFFPNQKQDALKQRLQKIGQLLIRYDRQKSRYLHRKGLSNMNFRKARTRTLIQLGGLIEKSGLLEALQFTPGMICKKTLSALKEWLFLWVLWQI